MADENIVNPIYDRVKHQIYDDYERLSRQSALLLNIKGRTLRINALRHFRRKFLNFFNNFWLTDVYATLPRRFRAKLEMFAENERLIKTKKQVRDITFTCGSCLRYIGIAKITYTKTKDDIL